MGNRGGRSIDAQKLNFPEMLASKTDARKAGS